MPRTLKPPSTERAAAEDEVSHALAARDFRAASAAVATYEAKQPVARGMGIDWKNHNPTNDILVLEAIYSHIPTILTGVLPQAVEPLRFAAAMMYLWGGHKRRWLPIDLPNGTHLRADAASRMFLFYGYSQRSIAGWKPLIESGAINRAEVTSCKDACKSCQRMIGGIYDVAGLPEFPHPNCKSDKGCRCSLSPVLVFR